MRYTIIEISPGESNREVTFYRHIGDAINFMAQYEWENNPTIHTLRLSVEAKREDEEED